MGAFYPLSACEQNALERQTALAASSARLFQDPFVPTPANVLADYTAAIATFTGYSNQAVAAWLGPLTAPGGGWMITTPLLAFIATDGATPNTINGAYLVDAGGELRLAVVFDEPIAVAAAGNGALFYLVMTFTTGE